MERREMVRRVGMMNVSTREIIIKKIKEKMDNSLNGLEGGEGRVRVGD
ncbi:hypothetical protein [Streptomyces sp. YIM S03343]